MAESAEQRRAFAILWLGQFVAIGGLTVVVPLLPFYLADLGTAPDDIAWWTAITLAAPAVAQMLTGPVWGWVGDRYGRKAMVVRAQGGLALSVALMALADTPAEFLACRLLQGAFGGVVAATATLASSVTSAQRRGRTLGGLFGATAAGSLVGPLLGSLLTRWFGFSALFSAVAVLLLTAALLTMVFLHEQGRDGSSAPSRMPVRTAALLLFRRAQSRNLLLAGLFAQAGVYALVVVFAPRVAQVGGSVETATVWVGVLQATTWGASLLGGPWWGRRHDRRPPQRGFALAALGCGVAVALQALPTDPALLLPLRLAQGFCFAAVIPCVLQVVSLLAPSGGRGACLGLATSTLELGQVLGPPIGAAAALLFPLPGSFAVISVLFGLAAALATISAFADRDPIPLPDFAIVRDLPDRSHVKAGVSR